MASNKPPADGDSVEVFNLNAVKVEAKKFPPFRFVWGPEGRRWEMTHQELLNQIPLLEGAESGAVHGTLAVLREALGPKQWAEFRKIPLLDEQAEQLLKAYYKHCGVEPGELPGSTDS